MARARRSNARPDAVAHPTALERPLIVRPSYGYPGKWCILHGIDCIIYFDTEFEARMWAAAHNTERSNGKA